MNAKRIGMDLAMAYHMGYEDALARRTPDASKARSLASDDQADEAAILGELVADMWRVLGVEMKGQTC